MITSHSLSFYSTYLANETYIANADRKDVLPDSTPYQERILSKISKTRDPLSEDVED